MLELSDCCRTAEAVDLRVISVQVWWTQIVMLDQPQYRFAVYSRKSIGPRTDPCGTIYKHTESAALAEFIRCLSSLFLRFALFLCYDVCREQRSLYRKTKIGTEVATSHLTRTPLSMSKGQRSTCRGRGHIVAASRAACFFFSIPSALIAGPSARFLLQTIAVAQHCYLVL